MIGFYSGQILFYCHPACACARDLNGKEIAFTPFNVFFSPASQLFTLSFNVEQKRKKTTGKERKQLFTRTVRCFSYKTLNSSIHAYSR